MRKNDEELTEKGRGGETDLRRWEAWRRLREQLRAIGPLCNTRHSFSAQAGWGTNMTSLLSRSCLKLCSFLLRTIQSDAPGKLDALEQDLEMADTSVASSDIELTVEPGHEGEDDADKQPSGRKARRNSSFRNASAYVDDGTPYAGPQREAKSRISFKDEIGGEVEEVRG